MLKVSLKNGKTLLFEEAGVQDVGIAFKPEMIASGDTVAVHFTVGGIRYDRSCHFTEVEVAGTVYDSAVETIGAIGALCLGFNSGGGSPEIPEEPEETSKWQPHPDWWDIKKIFDADTDPNKRFILLITDGSNGTSLTRATLGNSTAYYKTSDGMTYNAATNLHTWDTPQDKPCGDGYKTRWVMVCSDNPDVVCNVAALYSMWAYFGNASNITSLIGNGTSASVSENRILKAVQCSDDVTIAGNAIANYAFQGCASPLSVNIPNGVTSIGSSAFVDCYCLPSIVLPKGVTSIGDNAFKNCCSLSSIVLPDGITNIGNSAFTQCYSLESAVLPSGITSIVISMFQNCPSLKSINIPNGVTSIGSNAFINCYSLPSIVLPDGITDIGNSAFNACRSLRFINIPKTVTSIGSSAFQGCSSISSIVIPKAVTSIGSGAFLGMYSLLNFNCEPGWIACANINVSDTRLSVSSMVDFFTNLGVNTGTPITITLGGMNLSKLDTMQKTIATNKGYTLA